MKQFNLTRELLLCAIMLIPVIYLWISWESLPERVPIHFNLEGKADGWTGKPGMLATTFLTTFGLYLLMLFIPKIDPKRKLDYMGGKYDQLRVIMTLFMSALITFTIYYAQNQQETSHFSFLILLIGGILTALGNYFQALKPNYFIGIRTPWTLESNTVWRKTHRLSGRLWMIGGSLIMILAFVPLSDIREVLLIITFTVIIVVPTAYSFLESRKEQQLNKTQ